MFWFGYRLENPRSPAKKHDRYPINVLPHFIVERDPAAAERVPNKLNCRSLAGACNIIRLMETATNYRYIVKTEGVRGGNARVEGTRIGVHDVVGLLQNGETIDSIPNCFPDITRAQVYECLAYYEDHRGEIDLLIARQMAEPAQ